jgi:cephalosporin hydroxylase
MNQTTLRSIEAKAFVPARDFDLSRRFYKAIGFTEAWGGSDLAEFRHGDSCFLLQKFYVPQHAGNFMMSLLVEDADAWWEHVAPIAATFGKPAEKPADQPWGMRDFPLIDPSGVLWRIGHPINPTPPKVKEPTYRDRLQMSLADWMIHHQEKIVFDKVSWMGVRTLKNVLDCWIYQEILWETSPDVLIEIGSYAGGSTMFFCHLFDLIGHGQVLSLDIDRTRYQAKHPRLTDITGDCSDPVIVAQVQTLCAGKKAMVIHDGDHRAAAVLRDLRLYADLVPVGGYMIVEDGVVDLFTPQASAKLGWAEPGPMAATKDFLREDDRFEVDESRERYIATYNPRGYLKRVK